MLVLDPAHNNHHFSFSRNNYFLVCHFNSYCVRWLQGDLKLHVFYIHLKYFLFTLDICHFHCTGCDWLQFYLTPSIIVWFFHHWCCDMLIWNTASLLMWCCLGNWCCTLSKSHAYWFLGIENLSIKHTSAVNFFHLSISWFITCWRVRIPRDYTVNQVSWRV